MIPGDVEASCNLGLEEPRGLSVKACSLDAAGHCGVAGRAMGRCKTLCFGRDLANWPGTLVSVDYESDQGEQKPSSMRHKPLPDCSELERCAVQPDGAYS